MSRVEARRQEMLDALVLDDRRWDDPPPETVAARLRGHPGAGAGGAGLEPTARLLRARIRYAAVADVSDAGLLDRLEDWALPYLDGIRDAAASPGSTRPRPARLVGWQGMAEVDRLAPQHWTSPLGRKLAIDYGGDMPEIAVRLQEVLGTTEAPDRGPGSACRSAWSCCRRQAARSRSRRTCPGFWAGSYADVRKDMRAQYPRHPWPEDPTTADPTLRAKPREILIPLPLSPNTPGGTARGQSPLGTKRNDAQRHRRIRPVWRRNGDTRVWPPHRALG
jgi:ATP-dependent helicase HrpB